MTAVSGMKIEAKPWYSDQILPFDITLAGTSETGAATAMKIYGVEILNEGSGVSIDDAVTEMQAKFVVRLVETVARLGGYFGGDKNWPHAGDGRSIGGGAVLARFQVSAGRRFRRRSYLAGSHGCGSYRMIGAGAYVGGEEARTGRSAGAVSAGRRSRRRSELAGREVLEHKGTVRPVWGINYSVRACRAEVTLVLPDARGREF